MYVISGQRNPTHLERAYIFTSEPHLFSLYTLGKYIIYFPKVYNHKYESQNTLTRPGLIIVIYILFQKQESYQRAILVGGVGSFSGSMNQSEDRPSNMLLRQEAVEKSSARSSPRISPSTSKAST